MIIDYPIYDSSRTPDYSRYYPLGWERDQYLAGLREREAKQQETAIAVRNVVPTTSENK